jgi:hypothetical protein
LGGVAAFDSHFFRAPCFSLPGSPCTRRRMFFLERTFIRTRSRWTGPVSLTVGPMPASALPHGSHFMQVPIRTGVKLPRIQRPKRKPRHVFPDLLPARFCAPKALGIPRRIPVNFGQTSPSPAASTGVAEWSFRTLWDRPAGTQTHSRRTGRKLGQDRYARQALVRVPESNTKYGGKGGKTGGDAAPVIAPSISESSEIRQGKESSSTL